MVEEKTGRDLIVSIPLKTLRITGLTDPVGVLFDRVSPAYEVKNVWSSTSQIEHVKVLVKLKTQYLLQYTPSFLPSPPILHSP